MHESFELWKYQNYERLMSDYKSNKNCGDSMRSTDDVSFDDYCIGMWQHF